MRNIIIMFLCLCIKTPIYSQAFQNYSTKDGSPLGAMLGISQDQDGFLWIATPGGLYRFDSRNFKGYHHVVDDSTSLVSSCAMNVLVDSKNRLWVATDKGISILNRETDSFVNYRHDPLDPYSISHNYVTCIFEDSRNRIWIGTANGLNLLEDSSLQKAKFKRIQSFTDNAISSIGYIENMAEGSLGEIWVGTNSGLLNINSYGSVVHRYLPTQAVVYGHENGISALYYESDKRIWVGTKNGRMCHFNPKLGQFEVVDNFLLPDKKRPVIKKILPDDKGNMWVSTLSGLAYIKQATYETSWYVNNPENPYSLADNFIYSSYRDKNGALWLGTYYNGLSYFNPRSKEFNQFLAPEVSIKNNRMLDGHCGLSEDGMVWAISNSMDEIRLFNQEYRAMASYPLQLFSEASYNYFYLDRNKILWCGGVGVLTRYNLLTRQSQNFYLPKEMMSSTSFMKLGLPLNDQERLVLVDTKLLLFNEMKGHFQNVASFNVVLTCGLRDSKTNIWLGGRHGKLYRLKKDGSGIREYHLENRDGNRSDVYKINEDMKGRIWVLSNEQIWFYNSEQDLFEEVKLFENSHFISDFLFDQEGFLWLVADRLYCVDIDTGEKYGFDERDGLPVKGSVKLGEGFKLGNGDLVLLTTKGPFAFRPASVRGSLRQAPIVMTGLKLFNQPVTINDETGIIKKELSTEKELSLKYDQNFITLDFALLSFEKADLNQYAYRLEGFEKEWNNVNTPSANYTNLPPGIYTFYVKAANAEGNWTEETKMLTITVSPPWWRTWYAYLGYLVLLVWVGNKLLQFLLKRNTQKREHEMYLGKIDFLTNVAHEIRTHLLLISAPLEKAILKTEPTSESMAFLQRTQKSSDMLRMLVGDLLDFRKLENGKKKLFVAEHNISNLIKYIVGVYEHIAESKGITTVVTLPKEDILGWIDLGQFQKVISNLLHNAYKFTPEGGEVKVEVVATQYEIFILITDNGMGIKPEYLSKLFTNFFQVDEALEVSTGYGIGLALSRQIIQMHHGDIRVRSIVASSGQNGSTCFTICLKKGKEHFATDELRNQAVFSNEGVFLPIQNTYDRENNISHEEAQYLLLLIEDNEELRDFMYEVFKPQFRVLTASTGLEGIRLAKDRIPDIIISDIMMPEMNGIELCKQLKSSQETSHIPIILASAKGENQQIVDGLASGADDYFVKPFDINILELKIQNILKTQQAFRGRYQQNSLFETPNTEVIEDPFVAQLRATVLENISERNFGVNEIAAEVGMSVSVLYRKLRAITGYTVNDFIKAIRIGESANLIKTEQYSIVEVAMLVGYEDAKYFSKEFKKVFGCTPSKYVKKSDLRSLDDSENDE